MENEFIPYKQALALKELGFNEECFKIFIDDKLENFSNESQEYIKNSDFKNNYVTAPLYQQSFRWFREKCNLNYFIDNTRNEGNYKYSIYKREKSESVFPYKWNVECYSRIDYKTYEEAELECLKKLIEICSKLK